MTPIALRRFCLASMIVAAPLAAARADITATYSNGGEALFSIVAPDGWALTAGLRPGANPEHPTRPRVIGLTPEDDLSFWLGFAAPPEVTTLVEADAYIRALGALLMDNPSITEPEPVTIGDSPAQHYFGSGTREGAPVDARFAAIEMHGSAIAIAFFIGEYGARDVYQAEIAAIAASFKALGGK
jgi:hypothetical protein